MRYGRLLAQVIVLPLVFTGCATEYLQVNPILGGQMAGQACNVQIEIEKGSLCCERRDIAIALEGAVLYIGEREYKLTLTNDVNDIPNAYGTTYSNQNKPYRMLVQAPCGKQSIRINAEGKTEDLGELNIVEGATLSFESLGLFDLGYATKGIAQGGEGRWTKVASDR